MSAADDASDGIHHAPLDQLRHDLKTPLTTIHGRAQLLDRAIRSAPSLTDGERGKMLEGIAAIETAVRTLNAVVDAIGDGKRRP
jgi:signal transduction histidine kinase